MQAEDARSENISLQVTTVNTRLARCMMESVVRCALRKLTFPSLRCSPEHISSSISRPVFLKSSVVITACDHSGVSAIPCSPGEGL